VGSYARSSFMHAGAAARPGAAGIVGIRSDLSSSSGPTTTTTLPVTDGDEALARLMAGNARFVAGQPLNQGRGTLRRAETAQGQSPFAVILSCSDSRVSPEIIFDEGLGDLFVVRVAGNTAETPIVQGSIEYSVEHLHTLLVMVLGHQACGAVKAALDTVAGAPAAAGQITSLVTPILPAAHNVRSLPKDRQLDAAIAQNVTNQVAILRTLQPTLAPEITDGRVKLVGAEYVLDSGGVQLLS
jgi:carbonic anhydrase